MRIIEIEQLENGAHRNQQGEFRKVPQGWAVIPGNIIIPSSFPFVDITVDGQTVMTMTEREVPETPQVPDVPEVPDAPPSEESKDVYDEIAEAYTKGVDSI